MDHHETQLRFNNHGHGGMQSSGFYLRVCIAMSTAFFFAFSAWHPLQNMETTIAPSSDQNSTGISGRVSLGIVYGSNVLAAGSIAPFLVRRFGGKFSMLVQFTCFLVYTLANLYPRTYTIYPASILVGVGSALLWVGEGYMITELAVQHAKAEARKLTPPSSTTVPPPSLSSTPLLLPSPSTTTPPPPPPSSHTNSAGLFNGMFFTAFALTQLVGNLVSSVVLDAENSTNATNIVLFLMYIGFIIAAIFVTVIFIPRRISPKPRLKNTVLTVKKDIILSKQYVKFDNDDNDNDSDNNSDNHNHNHNNNNHNHNHNVKGSVNQVNISNNVNINVSDCDADNADYDSASTHTPQRYM